jgi:phosphoribosyl 1,2-cyclic phosphodiesterase
MNDDENFVKFLGTAGARFVVMRQLRASGGLWFRLDGISFLVDPGPGTLVRATASKPKLDPADLSAIILSHRHLDHSNDVNIMIEAMTNGGFAPKGLLIAPEDALTGDEPIVFRYLRSFLSRIEVMKEGGKYELPPIVIETPVRHHHQGMTYGLNISYSGGTISYIPDTLFFPELTRHYRGNTLIINTVRLKPNPPDKPGIMHLNLEDAKRIIAEVKPDRAVLTHFGMTMIRAKPWQIAEKLSEELGIKVIAAGDGLKLPLPFK